ncbi:4-vinyl reductase [Candidatus Micrarchaeota archaeon]|nr:4-vinyl reductase [Candidatus Micrarchaeota archaeon]
MSYDILSKFIATKILRFENGSLSLLDRNMVIIPAEVILKLQEDLEKKLGNEEAANIVYNAGRFETVTGSVRYLKRRDELKTVFSSVSKTGDPSIEMGREMLKFMGKGDIQIREVLNKGEKIILSSNSPFSAEYLKTRGKSNGPVCHYLRGVMCGVMEAYYGGKYRARELSCAATGLSKDCIFEFVRD